MNTDALFETLATRIRQIDALTASGDTESAEVAKRAALRILDGALEDAFNDGAAEGASDDDGRDPAEDFEPDISEVGFNPYEGGYDNDC